MPWALVGALAILVAFEVALRASGWPRRLPYDNGPMEYHAASFELDRVGPAEVSIVGSSRTRESLILPDLSKILHDELGRDVTVASYAASGAYSSDFASMTQKILRSPTRPRLILVGVSERDFVRDGAIWDQVPIFWDFAAWRRAFAERGRDVLADLPVVVRNTVGQSWRTLGLRELIRFRASQLVRFEFEPDPIPPTRGGLSIWQRSSPGRNLVKNPVKKSKVLERSAAMKLSEFPNPELDHEFINLLSDCQKAGVPIVLYEVHTSRALQRALPRGFYAAFQAYVDERARAYGSRYVRLKDLGLELGDFDMREPSHMSVRGATKLTEALAKQVVLPRLSAGHSTASTRPAE